MRNVKDKYISDVLKLLSAPRSKKREIARDLQEAFASASEHGETSEQVIERLGNSDAFARSLSAELGIPYGKRRTLNLALGILLLVIGSILIAAYLIISAATGIPNSNVGIIGGADGPTQIYLSPSDGIDGTAVILALGIIFILLSVAFLIFYIKRRR